MLRLELRLDGIAGSAQARYNAVCSLLQPGNSEVTREFIEWSVR